MKTISDLERDVKILQSEVLRLERMNAPIIAERDRYRAALEEIDIHCKRGGRGYTKSPQTIAREALGK